MSKTVDELREIFKRGQQSVYAAGYPVSLVDVDNAGIAAVIRALRDDTAINSCACKFWLDDILGSDAGAEKVAGGPTREDGQSCNSSDGSSPATDPAPAVCVWVPLSGGRHLVQCRDYVGPVAAKWLKKGECPMCKAPIKFTEAKT